jgi:hypothetical protein
MLFSQLGKAFSLNEITKGLTAVRVIWVKKPQANQLWHTQTNIESAFGLSLSNLAALIRMNFLIYR